MMHDIDGDVCRLCGRTMHSELDRATECYGRTGTAGTGASIKAFDLNAMRAAINRFEPEPVGKYMRAHGHDPADGWVLMIPARMWPDWFNAPDYCKRSPLLDDPFFINTRATAI